ncbi:hypothetical protein BZA05DRAFT_62703 [Tricharina praecox]|uniref:uncharacterized protein n=1 Tax=Tricharina praecox TaxID=43433 RepID=UPI0022200051|nr:uncharacterized protein BZA05DRAFT_62703 [Tricharina praecox]KAI5850748.1 hypothetical protein BZA05DRAFT_62703 [Tricharina praecox]
MSCYVVLLSDFFSFTHFPFCLFPSIWLCIYDLFLHRGIAKNLCMYGHSTYSHVRFIRLMSLVRFWLGWNLRVGFVATCSPLLIRYPDTMSRYQDTWKIVYCEVGWGGWGWLCKWL